MAVINQFPRNDNEVLYFLDEPFVIGKFVRKDSLYVSIIFCFSILSRFLHFHIPTHRGFDEFYFGEYISYYIKRTYFWDIHPPLSKMIIAGMAYLGGYDGSIDFRFPKKDTFDDSMYFFLRSIPAYFSSFIAPLTYICARLYGFNTLSCLFVSVFVMTDLMLIAESRLILTDALLLFFVVLSMFYVPFYISRYSTVRLLIQSLFLSFAVCTKWTSGGVVIFVMFCIGFDMLKRFPMNTDLVFMYLLRIFTICIIIISFVISMCSFHMSIFLYGSDFRSGLQSQMNSSLIYPNETYDPLKRNNAPNFFIKAFDNIYSLFHYSISESNLSVESKPYQWPLGQYRWMCFSHTREELTVAFGQISNWTVCFVITMIATLKMLYSIYRHNMKKEYCRTIIFLVGFWASYGPFYLVKRAVYTYHYLIPQYFSIFVSAAWINDTLHNTTKGFLFVFLIFTSISGYLFWSPLVYGYPVKDTNFRIWSRKWIPFLLE